MIVKYDDITIKGKCNIKKGVLNIADCGITVVTGENGAGKTLLVKNIYKNCRKDNKKASFVDQSSSMILHKESVLSNISMSYDSKEQERVKGLLMELGIESILALDSAKLSGGEKRLICILRELVKINDLLIIDEPTNDLSDCWCQLVLNLLKRYSAHFPVIIVSHDLRLKQIADTNVKVLENGQVITYDNEVVEDKDKSAVISNSKEFSLKLIKNNFNILPMIILFLFVQIIVLMVFFINADSFNCKNVEKFYPDNTIEVFLPISSTAEEYKEFSLPVSLISFVKGKSSLLEVYDDWKSEDERLSHKNMVFCLEELYFTMSDKVIVKEMYSPRTNEYINSMTLGIDSENEVNSLLKELVGEEDLYITHMTVAVDKELKELIYNLNHLDLMHVKIYSYNNEIGDFVSNLLIITEIKSLIKIEVFLCLIVIIGFFFLVNDRKIKKTALLFYQYGYKKKDVVLYATKRRELCLLLLLVSAINICLLLCIKVMGKATLQHIFAEYIIVMIVSCFVVISYYILKKKTVEKSFSWRWR